MDHCHKSRQCFKPAISTCGKYHDLNTPLNPSSFPCGVSPLNYLYKGRQLSTADDYEFKNIMPNDSQRVEEALLKRARQNRAYIENINAGMFARGGTNVDPSSFSLVTPDEYIEQPKILTFSPDKSVFTPILQEGFQYPNLDDPNSIYNLEDMNNLRYPDIYPIDNFISGSNTSSSFNNGINGSSAISDIWNTIKTTVYNTPIVIGKTFTDAVNEPATMVSTPSNLMTSLTFLFIFILIISVLIFANRDK